MGYRLGANWFGVIWIIFLSLGLAGQAQAQESSKPVCPAGYAIFNEICLNATTGDVVNPLQTRTASEIGSTSPSPGRQPPARAPLARIEIHSFQTTSPSDQQFLAHLEGAPTATIAGELRIPKPGDDKLPAVVLLHGSGGVTNGVDVWARELLANGAAVFIIDSLTGRGLVNLAPDQDRLSRFAQVVDAYRALDLLSKHPRIDPKRIAVMGFSRGGGAAHWAALERFRAAYASKGQQFAAFVAFYPTCNRMLRGEAALSSGPVRILHGTADNYVPIRDCRDYVARQKAAGHDIALIEIAGGHHIFDDPNLPAEVKVANFQTTRGCPAIEETAEGVLVNSQTKSPFLEATDPCVERGVSIGYSAEGRATASRVVREFFATVLKAP